VIEKVISAMNDHGKALKGSHIHVAGVAYKRDIDDVRESPALDIIHLLQKKGAQVTYSDPYVPRVRLEDHRYMEAQDLFASAAEADCVVIVTDHSGVDYARLLECARLIVDSRNSMKHYRSEKIVRL
jgi:UDP-N-acetyl-D-glucosamine dehydrogenase